MKTLSDTVNPKITPRQESEFRMSGLAKAKSITCETPREDCFWPSVEHMSQSEFDAIWDMMDVPGAWKSNPTCIISHTGLTEDGTPLNPVFVRIETI